MKLIIVLLVVIATCGAAFELDVILAKLGQASRSKTSIFDLGLKFLSEVRTSAETYLKDHPEAKHSDHPYFNFIPMWRASLVPDKKFGDTKWKASCFSQNSAHATTDKNGKVQLHITTSGSPATETCYDHYAFMTVTGIKRVKIASAGDLTIEWNVPADVTSAEQWDLAQKGVRVMEILTDEPTTIANLLQTVLLFVPEFTQAVGPVSAQANVDFINSYTKFHLEHRDPLTNLPPPAELVHSGDFFGILRLDGLDPMLSWGMGSTTGHTTVALWIDGELYICESTITDSYWPTDGIQKTPYKTWLKQAEQAGYNVVHAPLSAASRAKFNTEKAVEFFKSVEGYEYGYINMLWGWIDTLYANYPCLPDDYSSVCLTWEVVEPLFAVIDRNVPAISDQMWNQAWNKRIGTTGLRTAAIYQTATVDQGIPSRTIPTIVEQDGWTYNTTRNGVPAEGPSMVCCVFVCNVWKHSGLFDGMDINCAEQTNIDDYSLAIFEPEYKQIMGRWTLALNNYNTKIPFSHMGETCPTFAPDYAQDPTC